MSSSPKKPDPFIREFVPERLAVLETLSHELMAAGKFIGLYCRAENMDWLECKGTDSTGHPGTCLVQGDNATRCANEAYVLP
jgi:hypothetical protein